MVYPFEARLILKQHCVTTIYLKGKLLARIEIASSMLWQVSEQVTVSLVNCGSRKLKEKRLYDLPGPNHRKKWNAKNTASWWFQSWLQLQLQQTWAITSSTKTSSFIMARSSNKSSANISRLVLSKSVM